MIRSLRYVRTRSTFHLPRDGGEQAYKGAVMSDDKSQSDKFKGAARDLDCDENKGRWEKRLRDVMKHKTEEKPE